MRVVKHRTAKKVVEISVKDIQNEIECDAAGT